MYKIYHKGRHFRNKLDQRENKAQRSDDGFQPKNRLSKTHKNIVIERLSVECSDKSKDFSTFASNKAEKMPKTIIGGSNKMKKFNERLRERFAKGWGKSH